MFYRRPIPITGLITIAFAPALSVITMLSSPTSTYAHSNFTKIGMTPAHVSVPEHPTDSGDDLALAISTGMDIVSSTTDKT